MSNLYLTKTSKILAIHWSKGYTVIEGVDLYLLCCPLTHPRAVVAFRAFAWKLITSPYNYFLFFIFFLPLGGETTFISLFSHFSWHNSTLNNPSLPNPPLFTRDPHIHEVAHYTNLVLSNPSEPRSWMNFLDGIVCAWGAWIGSVNDYTFCLDAGSSTSCRTVFSENAKPMDIPQLQWLRHYILFSSSCIVFERLPFFWIVNIPAYIHLESVQLGFFFFFLIGPSLVEARVFIQLL